jgi:hypothetical protein
MRRTKYLFAIGAITVGLVTSAQMALAQSVVPPSERSFALSYGEWGARWYQYHFEIPADQNPIFDSTGKDCALGQWGPVFFLVGAFGGKVTRSQCEVPAGTGLFFPIINIACAIPDDGNTPAAIVQVCSPAIDAVDTNSLFVTIDGTNVPNLRTFRASEFFSFTGAIPGPESTACTGATPHCYEGFRDTAFTDGYWMMLQPLPIGHHTVRFGGAIPSFGFKLDVTYQLKVVSQ